MKRFKSTDPDEQMLKREKMGRRRTRCPRRAINFVFRLNTRRWDCTGRKFISRLLLSVSLSSPRCGVARDRGSFIAFRAGCLSTHSVTEAVYRKFKLFRRTKLTEKRTEERQGTEKFSRQTDTRLACAVVPYMPLSFV